MKLKLMTPGPVEVPREVLAEASKPVVSHRSPEFREILGDVVARLLKLADAPSGSYAAVLAGSGTTAVDAMVWSLVRPGERVLVASFGEFGERLKATAELRGAVVDVVEYEWGSVPDANALAERVERGGYAAVLIVHNETSTGVAFRELRVLGEAAERSGALLLVDSVSGLAGEELSMREWRIDAVASCTHKAIAAPPGASFVLMGPRAVEKLRSGVPPVPPSIDLRRYVERWDRDHETPFTPAVNTIYSLRRALIRILDEVGLDSYIRGHAERASVLYRELPAAGLEPMARSPRYASNTVTAFKLPKGVNASDVVRVVRESGYLIARGMGRFKESVIRIGVMGDVTVEDAARVAEAVKRAVHG